MSRRKEIKIFLNGKLKCIIPDYDNAVAIIENVKDIYKGQGDITVAPLASQKFELTKSSLRALKNLPTGSGHVFISDGSGYKHADVQFVNEAGGYYITIGNKKAIKLDHEQELILRDFFIQKTRRIDEGEVYEKK
jgi:hypothetical protein